MKINKRYFIFAVLLVFCVMAARDIFAQMPREINIQGQLLDSQGNPVTGNRRVKFTFYNEETGGEEIASYEEDELEFSDRGLYRAEIDMSGVENLNQALWLGVEIGDGPEMDGRIKLLPSALALYAGTAGEVNWDNITDKPEDIITEESDPVFTAHVAYDIEQTHIDNWDEAHAERGSQIAGSNLEWSEGNLNVTDFDTEETDPVFTAHVAHGIEEADIDNWDEAHAERGSQIAGSNLEWSGGNLNVTDFDTEETDPIFNAHVASDIEQAYIDNWDEAYAERGSQIAGSNLEWSEGYLNVTDLDMTETDPTWSGAADTESEISRTGSVGIGSDSPSAKLDLGYTAQRQTDETPGLIVGPTDLEGSEQERWSRVEMLPYVGENEEDIVSAALVARDDFFGIYTYKYDTGGKAEDWNVNLAIDYDGNIGLGTRRDDSIVFISETESNLLGEDIKPSLLVGRADSEDDVARFELYQGEKSSLYYASEDHYGFYGYDGEDWNEGLQMDYQGNVGIGTSEPEEKLDVDGNVHIRGDSNRIGDTSYTVPLAVKARPKLDSTMSGYGLKVVNGESDSGFMHLTMGVDPEYAEIYVMGESGSYGDLLLQPPHSNGNVGIGTPPSSSYRLDVDGDIYTSGGLTEGSDIALKENIEDLGYGLDEVMNIQAREFNMKESGEKDIGFIAQELEDIIPELVSGEEGSKGISYSKLTAVLVNALQEQQKRIEVLESQINDK